MTLTTLLATAARLTDGLDLHTVNCFRYGDVTKITILGKDAPLVLTRLDALTGHRDFGLGTFRCRTHSGTYDGVEVQVVVDLDDAPAVAS